MKSGDALLPAGFGALEPFVETWSVAGAANRARRRTTSSAEQRQAFYETARTLLAPALTYLDAKPLDALDEQDQRLMNLMLCFAHVAQAIEVQGDDEARHAILRETLTITQASADFP